MIKKHAKIYGKISDLKCDPGFLQSIHEVGFNVVWLNTAHQEIETTKQIIKNVQQVSPELSIIVDTKGPEIRMAGIEQDAPVPVTEGQTLYMTGDLEKTGDDTVHVDYPTFAEEVPVGSQILIDDGEIGLTVTAVEDGKLACTVDNVGGGKIKRKKSVNVPGVDFKNLQALTEKDKSYIHFAAETPEIDYVIHSFVRSKEDVMNIREILDQYDTKCGVIAKIENQAGVENVLNGEILDVVDGVMVARGDLAVEVPAYQVPIVQKQIIQKCLEKGKVVMVATQALHTMIENPRPTRAEASDIVNALLDGADIVTLSGETAYGEYPVEAVDFMAKAMIATEKERNTVHQATVRVNNTTPVGVAVHEAVKQAEAKGARAFIVPNRTHETARALATFHLDQYIYAVSDNQQILRQIAAHSYGVERIEASGTVLEQIATALTEVAARENLADTDVVAIVDADGGEGISQPVIVDTLHNLKQTYTA